MANASTKNNRDEVELPVAQQDMRFCVTQWNKKCLKSFKAFVPFGLKRKRKKKITNFHQSQIGERLAKKVKINIEST
jgi:hypothetical protein